MRRPISHWPGCLRREVALEYSQFTSYRLLRLRQGPLAGLVPDFVAGQPAPGGLNGENAGEFRRVPAAGVAGRALPPEAERLAFEQVRTVPERRKHARLRRDGWV